ncbi:MAG: CTP synthase [Phycisphaeraceae bacterium]|nr:CTP synthase [Phycisphaeraceae bacterium]MCW5767252.1 CTP synthase [Phycisphaeraceae bacterium]
MPSGRERMSTSSQGQGLGQGESGRSEPPAEKGWGASRRSGSASGKGDLLSSLAETTTSTELYSPVPDGYQRGRHRYVVVLGTVMSGLGKGIFASSVAKMLKDKGLTVAPIKMEGYLNIDSGTLNPYRHGEVFVLDDGTECDMDLGTYERMLDQNLTRWNFTTSGQVYSEILDRERQGVYLGRDVQMIPHVTGEVKRKLRELAMRGDGKKPADVVLVEVGGTVGDYENGFYIEALRELAFEEGPGSTCFVALTYVIEPKALGEQKSKAAQLGIKRLMEAGIQPQMIACRATNEVSHTVREKIAMFSNVPMRRVFSMHDRPSIYTIPEEMRADGLDREILSILEMHDRVDVVQEDRSRARWTAFTHSLTASHDRKVTIGITGKYAALRDAYASIDKALEHCSAHLKCDIEQKWIDTTEISPSNVAAQLSGLDGVIVPGGFGARGVEGKIACVRHCRENLIPYLGICLGFQVAVIEYTRNVLGLKDATSTEFDPSSDNAVISELPDQKKIEGLGGTMRLGAQDVQVMPGTLASFLFGGKTSVRERFRHRYEVDPKYIERLEAHGMVFSGRHPSQPIMQIIELAQPGTASTPGQEQNTHPYFIGAQYHPELTSRPLTPQPLFMGLVASAIGRKMGDQPESRSIRKAPELVRWLREGPSSLQGS